LWVSFAKIRNSVLGAKTVRNPETPGINPDTPENPDIPDRNPDIPGYIRIVKCKLCKLVVFILGTG